MTEGLENTRSENNQVSPPPLPCSVALRGVSHIGEVSRSDGGVEKILYNL